MKPAITIAIPCYNQAKFLPECLRSLVSQTFGDWEAIIVDDDSPDDPSQVAKAFPDPRIKILKHSVNKGLAASRNTAFRHATAPLVLGLDSDDFLHPEFLSETIAALEHANADCVFTQYQLFGSCSDIWEFKVKTADDLADSNWLPGPGTVMRRSVWERVGGYCEARVLRAGYEDYDFWIGAMTSGLSAACVPRPLYFYRRHEASMLVTSFPASQLQIRMFIFERHREFFQDRKRARLFLKASLACPLPASPSIKVSIERHSIKLKILFMKPSLLIRYFISIMDPRLKGHLKYVFREIRGKLARKMA